MPLPQVLMSLVPHLLSAVAVSGSLGIYLAYRMPHSDAPRRRERLLYALFITAYLGMLLFATSYTAWSVGSDLHAFYQKES